MIYIIVTFVLLILFMDVGIQVDDNNNRKELYILLSFIKIKIKLKSFESTLDTLSQKSFTENIDSFKKKLNLMKPIKSILASSTLDYIEIIKLDDINSLDLKNSLIISNFYYIINDLVNETFLYVKRKKFLYYPFNQKKIILNLKARINLFKLLKIIVVNLFRLIGGKIYEQSRRFFKGKP